MAEALVFAFVFDGTTHDMRVAPADLMRFQRKFKISYGDWAANLSTDPGSVDLEQMLYLGWLVATRTKLTEKEFEDWVDGVEFPDEQAVTVGDPLASGNNGSSGLPPLPDSTPELSPTST